MRLVAIALNGEQAPFLRVVVLSLGAGLAVSPEQAERRKPARGQKKSAEGRRQPEVLRAWGVVRGGTAGVRQLSGGSRSARWRVRRRICG